MKKRFILLIVILFAGIHCAFAQYSDPQITLEKKGAKIVCIQDGVQSYTPLNQVLDMREYEAYYAARKQIAWGKGIIAFGGVTTAFGAMMVVAGIDSAKNTGEVSLSGWLGTSFILGVGLAVTGTGISVRSLGHKKIKKIVTEYNISTTENGVGITMRF